MKASIKSFITTAAVVLALSCFVGCSCIRPVQKSRDGRLVILQQPISQIARTNSTVSFMVVAMHVGPPSTNLLTYQWSLNGNPIVGATNQTYTIGDVQFYDVGEYRVQITGSSIRSAPAYLGVYATTTALTGSSGTLSTPIGLFTSSAFPCGGVGFQNWYNQKYTNPSGASVYALFYGPNASGQGGPFMNSNGGLKLTVDTFSSSNETADTGLMVQNNWFPNGQPLPCNDDAAGGTDPRQSRWGPFTLSANSGTLMNSYRLTTLYKVPPGPPTGRSITINWKYE